MPKAEVRKEFAVGAGVLLFVAASDCAHSQPTAASGITPFPRASREATAPDSILWSSARRLSWGDFLGPPQISSAAGAVTSYVLWYEAECTESRFEYRVVSAFLPDKSWVKPGVLLRSDAGRVLRHEQTHFDLSEVHVRKARAALAALSEPCRRTREALAAVVDPFIREDGEAQRRYDRETVYGLDDRRQAEWDSAVAKQLGSLSRYAR